MTPFLEHAAAELQAIREQDLFKAERIIDSPQQTDIRLQDRLFETLLSDQDAIISDQLNHASMIDGIRLCKAQRFRYRNNELTDLEENLQASGRLSVSYDCHRRRVCPGLHI